MLTKIVGGRLNPAKGREIRRMVQVYGNMGFHVDSETLIASCLVMMAPIQVGFGTLRLYGCTNTRHPSPKRDYI